MKNKLIIAGLISATVVCYFVFANNGDLTQNQSQSNNNESTQVAVFTNVGFGSFTKNETLLKNKVQHSANAAANPFGISPIVLSYLQNTIPKDNAKAIYAALRYAQVQELLYNAGNKQQAVQAAVASNLPLNCMAKAMGFALTKNVQQKLDDIQQSTPSGKAQMLQAESYIAYQLIGPNLTVNQIESSCQQGDY
jgi:hypothetical protein